MTRKTKAQKLDFLYALSRRINEVSVVADRKGCGDVGELVLGIMDFVAAEIGLPEDYKEQANEDRLVNEGVAELMEQYPE
jgi:hypothetical protein